MAIFTINDMALTGFGVIRRRPLLLAWWTLLHVVFIGATSLGLVALAGPALTQMTALRATLPANDPAVQALTLAALRQLAPAYALMLPVMLVFYTVVYTAMNRAVLRPGDDRFGYLRLGLDELRQFGLFLWALVVGFGAYLAVAVISVIPWIIGAVLFAVLHKGPTSPSDVQVAVAWGAVAFVLLYMFGVIYVLVRLSLASAMTFATGKIRLLASWRLTKGRFWPMFGVWLLSFCLALVVGLLGLVVMLALCAVATGGVGAFAFIFRPDMSSLTAYLTPVRILHLLLSGVFYAAIWPILLTPRAAIYRSLAAPYPSPLRGEEGPAMHGIVGGEGLR